MTGSNGLFANTSGSWGAQNQAEVAWWFFSWRHGMNFVASYIIRVYRFEKDRPKSLVGVVFEAGKKGKKAFQSYDEFWEILNVPLETPEGRNKRENH
jgi:hypothetical protein